jgi:hypothetical protein
MLKEDADVWDPPEMVGELIDGELPKTKAPDPVSSEITPANSLDEVLAKTLNLLEV